MNFSRYELYVAKQEFCHIMASSLVVIIIIIISEDEFDAARVTNI